MMSSKNNGFTAGDIERYHSGKMTPAERHALEKAALDDPFLADALEGYTYTSTPSADLAKIQLQLDQKRKREKAIPLFQNYKWLRVAAMVLLIAGAGWLVYSISTNGNQLSTAKTVHPPASDQQSEAGVQKNVTDTAPAATTMKVETPQMENLPQESAGQSKTGSVEATRDEPLNDGRDMTLDSKATASQPAQATVQNESVAGNATAGVEQRNVAKNKAVSPHVATGNSNAPPASREEAPVTAPAMARSRNVSPDTVRNLDVVLQRLPSDSVQEVVVGYGAFKKANANYPHVIIDTLEPAGGYVKFDDYVANNLKMPDEYRAKRNAGEVQLSFDVNKDGEPVNITVVKSLCEKCDEEAIRLLKEGPKWKKKKNKKGKITIRF